MAVALGRSGAGPFFGQKAGLPQDGGPCPRAEPDADGTCPRKGTKGSRRFSSRKRALRHLSGEQAKKRAQPNCNPQSRTLRRADGLGGAGAHA